MKAIRQVERDIIFLMNLNACTGEDDTVQGTKDENHTLLKQILEKVRNIDPCPNKTIHKNSSYCFCTDCRDVKPPGHY